MKRFVYSIFSCMMLFLGAACSDDNPINIDPSFESDNLVISFSTGAPVSRATVEDEAYEYAVKHIDVYIFKDGDDDATRTKDCYQRVSLDNATTSYGDVAFTAKKRYEFTAGAQYWVYMVANSTATDEERAAVSSVEELKKLVQTDEYIDLTATTGEGRPTHFLMDGIAYLYTGTDDYKYVAGDNSGEPGEHSAVVLYDKSKRSTVLKAVLRRAAAKLVATFKPATDGNVSIIPDEETDGGCYYFRNVRTNTAVLADGTLDEADATQTIHKEDGVSVPTFMSDRFVYNEDGSVTVTGYVYSHSWDVADYADKGISLVVNLPIRYGVDGDTRDYTDNYYHIYLAKPVNDKVTFLRNYIYTADVTVNVLGSGAPTEPVELEMNYATVPWQAVDVNIDGSNKPHFLELNKYSLSIYNADTDNSLIFTSSSPVTVEIVNTSSGTDMTPYFYNEFNVKTYQDPSTTFYYSRNSDDEFIDANGNVLKRFIAHTYDAEYNVSSSTCLLNSISSPMGADWGVLNADGSYNQTVNDGEILIKSPSPENLAVRYFRLKVYNQDGDVKYVDVTQYPLTWVDSSTEGWFSFREDFTCLNGRYTTVTGQNDGGERLMSHRSTDQVTRWQVHYLWPGSGQGGLSRYEGRHYNLRSSGLFCNALWRGGDAGGWTYSHAFAMTHLFQTGPTQAEWLASPSQYWTTTTKVPSASNGGQYSSFFRPLMVQAYGAKGTEYEGQAGISYYTYSGDTKESFWTPNWSLVSSGTYPVISNQYAYESGPDRTHYTLTYGAPDNIAAIHYRWMRTKEEMKTKTAGNAHMYVVHVTSTSPQYTIARPRRSGTDPLTGESLTDGAADNANIVSPTFAFASMLGISGNFIVNDTTVSYPGIHSFTKSPTGEQELSTATAIKMAEQHCARYIEIGRIGSDGYATVYDNWRLPTKAELEYAINAQMLPDAVMYMVLEGSYYMSASGPVKNPNFSIKRKPDYTGEYEPGWFCYTRCVRDVYKGDPGLERVNQYWTGQ